LLRNLEAAQRNPRFEFRQIDVCDMEAMKTAARDIDVVMHLAAFKIPRYGAAIDTLLINSQGSYTALQVAKERGAKFVITSTSDVYGKNVELPFSETSNCVIGPSTVARWSYAVSKLYDEHLAFAFAEAYNIPVTIIRVFGSYGPRQNLSWWGGPQSVFIDAILRGETIPIHGDGQQTRSFTFVSDTVGGIQAAVESDAANGHIFNIGSTQEISIVDLAKMIHRLCGAKDKLNLQFVPYDEINGKKYEDVMRRVPDVSKAGELLGFRAKVGLEDGLLRTIEWQKAIRAAERDCVEAK
jgi:UDP-glucose 4-epimerase